MIPVALLLLAVATHVEPVDDVYRIPAGDWKFVDVGLRQKPAFISADLDVQSGSTPVRLVLLRRDKIERFQPGSPDGVLSMTDPGSSARLRYRVQMPGDYVVVIDNHRSNQAAEVHLRVDLDFATETRLPLQRQIVVIAISFAVFFAIAGFSARRLLRGIKR